MFETTIHQDRQEQQAGAGPHTMGADRVGRPASVLMVIANPDASSFSAAVAGKVREGLMAAGAATVEIADLAREGFDPRMGEDDLASYRGTAAPPDAVLREQARIDRADALVLVFPVYWWSMPALLKGWIDRVFTNGWAYTYNAAGKVIGNMRDRKVHLIGIGAGGPQKYESHGYRQSILTQIQHGIFEYCGIEDVATTLLLESESRQPEKRKVHLRTAYDIGRAMLAA